MISFYNTLSRQKEEFKPVEKGKVKIYSCGPTVYNFQHIGNMRAALCWDFLRRMFDYFGYEVIGVQNITDVGHLTSDEDEGEDKMLKASKKENKDPYEIAKFYTDVYLEDLKVLNVKLPKHMPTATGHIKEQIEIIESLEKNGFTYKTSDGIYFDTAKFEEYGKLSGQSLDEKLSGARVEENSEKKSPSDFALWKFLTGDNVNHIMKWDSPWGVGFPGWHIECSAMSHKYLGDEFDIHTGGIEHISVHHENEIAQNTCSGAVKKVNFWLHNAHMLMDSEKMSKSLGNVLLVKDLIEKGYNPVAFRALCLKTHYRKSNNFTFESLESSQKDVDRINHFYTEISNLKVSQGEKMANIEEIVNEYTQKFEESLENDLNTPQAIASVFEFINSVNGVRKGIVLNEKEKNLVLQFIEKTDLVLGLLDNSSEEISEEIISLAEDRKIARENKIWAESDRLRDLLKEKGYEIKDSKDSEKGYILKKV